MIEILLVAAWGGLVLAAMEGWGWAVGRLAPRLAVDPGLRCAGGMAALLAMGGVLTAFGLAVQPVVLVVVLAGAALSLVRWPKRADWRGIGPMGWLVGSVLAIHCIAQVAGVRAVCADDHAAYFGFIQRQLALGSVEEPFSLRRLAAHGGQTFLQSLVVAVGDTRNAFLVERGIAPVILYWLLRGALPRRGAVFPAVALAVTLLAPFYDFNSQSSCTGIVLFLGLARTLIALNGPAHARVGELAWVALFAAGLCALRAHFLVGAGLTIGLWLLCGLRDIRLAPALIGRAALLSCLSLVLFAPWCVGLWRSSGTPLFPLFPGTGAYGYDTFSSPGALSVLLREYVTSPKIIVMVIPLLAFWRSVPERPVLLIAYTVAVFMNLLMFWSLTSADTYHIGRYMWPMVFVPLSLSLIVLARSNMVPVLRRPVLAAVFTGGALLAGFQLAWDMGQLAAALDPERSEIETELARSHRAMQALVPAGETMLVATDHPYLVDYRRNRIVNLDLPGTASPAPGMPFFQGGEALRAYLLSVGVRHVLSDDGTQPRACLFDRARYAGEAMKREIPLSQLQARYILNFMENMDRVAARWSVLGRERHLVLVRLDGP